MPTSWNGELLLYAGAGIMAAAVAAGAIAAIVLRRAGKRLKERLEAEYGKKRC